MTKKQKSRATISSDGKSLTLDSEGKISIKIDDSGIGAVARTWDAKSFTTGLERPNPRRVKEEKVQDDVNIEIMGTVFKDMHAFGFTKIGEKPDFLKRDVFDAKTSPTFAFRVHCPGVTLGNGRIMRIRDVNDTSLVDFELTHGMQGIITGGNVGIKVEVTRKPTQAPLYLQFLKNPIATPPVANHSRLGMVTATTKEVGKGFNKVDFHILLHEFETAPPGLLVKKRAQIEGVIKHKKIMTNPKSIHQVNLKLWDLLKEFSAELPPNAEEPVVIMDQPRARKQVVRFEPPSLLDDDQGEQGEQGADDVMVIVPNDPMEESSSSSSSSSEAFYSEDSSSLDDEQGVEEYFSESDEEAEDDDEQGEEGEEGEEQGEEEKKEERDLDFFSDQIDRIYNGAEDTFALNPCDDESTKIGKIYKRCITAYDCLLAKGGTMSKVDINELKDELEKTLDDLANQIERQDDEDVLRSLSDDDDAAAAATTAYYQEALEDLTEFVGRVWEGTPNTDDSLKPLVMTLNEINRTKTLDHGMSKRLKADIDKSVHVLRHLPPNNEQEDDSRFQRRVSKLNGRNSRFQLYGTGTEPKMRLGTHMPFNTREFVERYIMENFPGMPPIYFEIVDTQQQQQQ